MEPYHMIRYPNHMIWSWLMWFFRAKKQIIICYMYILSPVSILGTYSINIGYKFIKMQNDLFFILYSE